jgi:hypothetical protein
MTSPKYRLPSARGYRLPTDGRIVPGVTSLTAAMDPDAGGLVGWASNLAAEAAVDTREEWDPLDLRGDAIALIKARARRQQEVARNVGTATHETIEALTIEEAHGPSPIPVEPHRRVLPYVRSWYDWREEVKPTFIETEVTLVNRQIGYAGTADTIAVVPQVGKVLVDYKTGKSVRRKDHGQMILLACAEAILRDDGTEESWLGVDALWLVQLRPEGWAIHEVPWDSQECVEAGARLAVGLVNVRNEADALEASVRLHTAPGALE